MTAVSDQPWMIQTAVPHIYEDLVVVKKCFLIKYDLFVLGLVYGLLHGKIGSGKPYRDMVRVNTIQNTTIKNIIDIVYMLLDDGRDERDVMDHLLRTADGGVEAINDIYYDNPRKRDCELDISVLIEEAKQIWPLRLKQLHNI